MDNEKLLYYPRQEKKELTSYFLIPTKMENLDFTFDLLGYLSSGYQSPPEVLHANNQTLAEGSAGRPVVHHH